MIIANHCKSLSFPTLYILTLLCGDGAQWSGASCERYAARWGCALFRTLYCGFHSLTLLRSHFFSFSMHTIESELTLVSLRLPEEMKDACSVPDESTDCSVIINTQWLFPRPRFWRHAAPPTLKRVSIEAPPICILTISWITFAQISSITCPVVNSWFFILFWLLDRDYCNEYWLN